MKRKSVQEQAKAYLERYGDRAEMYAHWRSNDVKRAATARYWEAVEDEIRKLREKKSGTREA